MAPEGGPAADGDERLARAVLPRTEDLAGEEWVPDEDEDDGGRPPALDVPVPAGFPEHAVTATVEATWMRGGAEVAPGIVHAIASTFAEAVDARTAWTTVADPGFAERFASSVAEAATGGRSVEL